MSHEPKRCVIVGCGGIGSWLAPALIKTLNAQAPFSAVVLVDGDNFEPKNAERQNYVTMGNKAEALRLDLSPNHPQCFIVSRPAWIVSQEKAVEVTELTEGEESVQKITAESLLNEGDLVFAVVDNYATRKLIFEAAKNYADIDVFSGGNGGVETGDPLFGSVYHYQRRNGIDVTSSPLVMHDEYANPPDRNPGELSCQERAELDGGSQLLVVNMHVATYLLMKACQTMFGTDEEKQRAIEKAEIYFDMSESAVLAYDRRPAPEEQSSIIISTEEKEIVHAQ
jgi:hypothetical protein